MTPNNRLRIRVFDVTVMIEVDDSSLFETARQLFASYAKGGERPMSSYIVQTLPSPRLLKNGACVYAASDVMDLLPALELDLVESVLAVQRDRWLLHAAAVSQNGEALVLVGPSGAGKSTLAAELVARGADYLSDDCVAVNAGGGLQGLRRPITFAADRVWPEMTAGGFAVGEYRVRGRDGSTTDFLLLNPPAQRLPERDATIKAMIRIGHSAEQDRPRVQQLSAGQALPLMWSCTLRPDQPALEVALSVLDSCDIWTLTSSSVTDALDIISRFWN